MNCPRCAELARMNVELIAVLNRWLFERMLDDIEEHLAESA